MDIARQLREDYKSARFAGVPFCYNIRMKALIIEDDQREQEFLRNALSELGYACTVEKDGKTGFDRLLGETYDLALVDIMLPHMDGKEIICQARAAGVDTPIIVVSALGAISDRVAGLALGADDYMPKPCAKAELKARVTALNRRFRGKQERVLDIGEVVLDTVSRTCKRNGRSIELSKIEFAILECLMRHRGTLVPKGLLIEQAWGYDMDPTTDIVPPHISRLRAKLSMGREKDPIENHRGLGYAFRP